MKQAKLIELGQMLEAWRHQVRSHGRTLTVQELCRTCKMPKLSKWLQEKSPCTTLKSCPKIC